MSGRSSRCCYPRCSPARSARGSLCGGSDGAELAEQRPGVERVEPAPPRDFLARRPRAFREERPPPLAGLLPLPPGSADVGLEVGAEVVRADPRAQGVLPVDA